MNGTMITNLVTELQNNPHLLAPIYLSHHAQVAMKCLIAMLDSLPPHSPVLQFITEQRVINHIKVTATLLDGKLLPLHSPRLFRPGFSLEGVTSQAGVYV
jgi:hypothetical protein